MRLLNTLFNELQRPYYVAKNTYNQLNNMVKNKMNTVQSDQSQETQHLDTNDQNQAEDYEYLVQKIIDQNTSGLLFFNKYISIHDEQFNFSMRFINGQDFKHIYRHYGENSIEILLNQNLYVKVDQYFVQISGERECKDTSTRMRYSLNKILDSNQREHFPIHNLSNKELKHNFINLIQNFQQFKRQLCSVFNDITDKTNDQTNNEFIQIIKSQKNNQREVNTEKNINIAHKLIFTKNEVEIIIRHIFCKLNIKNKLGTSNYNHLVKNIMDNFVCLSKNEYISIQALIKNISTLNQTKKKQNKQSMPKVAKMQTQFTQHVKDSLIKQEAAEQNNKSQSFSNHQFKINKYNNLAALENQIYKAKSNEQKNIVRQPPVITYLKEYVNDIMQIMIYLFGKLFYLVDSISELGKQQVNFFNSEYIRQLKNYQIMQSNFKYYVVLNLSAPNSKDYIKNLQFVSRLRYIYKGAYKFRPIMNCTDTYNSNAQSLMQILYKFVKPHYQSYQQQVNQALEYQHIQALDIKAAYDVIDQQLLFQIVLNRCGLLSQQYTVYKIYKFKRNQINSNTWTVWKVKMVTSQQAVDQLQEIIFNTHFIFSGKLYKLVRGVPQGSILSPLFCYVYYQHLINETIFYNIICANLNIKQKQQSLEDIFVGIYVDDLLISSNSKHLLDIFVECFGNRLGELTSGMTPLTKEDTWCNYDMKKLINVFTIKKKVSGPKFYFYLYLEKLKAMVNKIKISLRLNCAYQQYKEQIYQFIICVKKLHLSIDKKCVQQKQIFTLYWIQYIRILIFLGQNNYKLTFQQHCELKHDVYKYILQNRLLTEKQSLKILIYVKSIIKNSSKNNNVGNLLLTQQ